MSKTIVIIGASSGIGESVALEYAKKGYSLALCARREEKLESLKQKILQTHSNIKVETYSLDVNNLDSVPTVINQIQQDFTTLDVVIANAGITGIRKTGSGDLSTDLAIYQTNLLGAIACIDASAAIFKQQGHGHIVGVSSFSAYRGIPGSAAYSSSKAALSNYMQAVRTELFKRKISVTTIHPGFIKTDLADNMEKYPFVIDSEKAAQIIVKQLEQKKNDIIVPKWPWGVLKYIMPRLSDNIISKIFR